MGRYAPSGAIASSSGLLAPGDVPTNDRGHLSHPPTSAVGPLLEATLAVECAALCTLLHRALEHAFDDVRPEPASATSVIGEAEPPQAAVTASMT